MHVCINCLPRRGDTKSNHVFRHLCIATLRLTISHLLQTKALAAAAAFATLQPAIAAAAAQDADADCRGTSAVLAYPALVDSPVVPLPVAEIDSLKPADMHAADARTGVSAEMSSQVEALPMSLSLHLSTIAEEVEDSLQSSSDATPLQGLGGDTLVRPQSNDQHVRLAQQQASITVGPLGHTPEVTPDCSAEGLPEAQPASGACLGASQSVVAGAGALAMTEQPPAAAANARHLPNASSASPAARQDSQAGSAHTVAAGHSASARAAGPEAAVHISGSKPATQAAPLLAVPSSSRAAHVLTAKQAPATSMPAAMHAARLAAPGTAAMTAEAPLQMHTGALSQVRQHSSLEVSASGEILGCSRAALHEPRAATAARIWSSSGPATQVDRPAAAAETAAPSLKLQPSRVPDAQRPHSEAEGAAHRLRLKRQRRADSAPAAWARSAPAPSMRPALNALSALVDAHSLQVLYYMPGKQHPLSPP